MAQDEYYYEIQLTNKQLVFYFLAGATALILSFLAGIMVGRGVETRPSETRVREEAITPVTEDVSARRSASVESYSYPARLTSESVSESLATPSRTATPRDTRVASARTPSPVASRPAARPSPSAPARPSPTARRAETPRPAETVTLTLLQVGAFKDKAGADALAAQLRRKSYPVVVVRPDATRGGLYNVRVGPYRSRPDAERAKTRLEQDKFKPFFVKP